DADADDPDVLDAHPVSADARARVAAPLRRRESVRVAGREHTGGTSGGQPRGPRVRWRRGGRRRRAAGDRDGDLPAAVAAFRGFRLMTAALLSLAGVGKDYAKIESR